MERQQGVTGHSYEQEKHYSVQDQKEEHKDGCG